MKDWAEQGLNMAAAEVEATDAGDGCCLESRDEGGACKPSSDFKLPFETCLMCCQLHDSPEFGPYCDVCHAFLYPDTAAVAANENRIGNDGETSCLHVTLHDERNEKKYSDKSRASDLAGIESEDDSGCESENFYPHVHSNDHAEITNSSFKLPYLSLYEKVRSPYCIAERLAGLHVIDDGLVENLPPEILLMIFSNLDDISLCIAGQVCQRWRHLAGEPDDWKIYVDKRWPLLSVKRAKCWRTLYQQLLQSVTCRRCFEDGCVQRSPGNDLVNTWRDKRLRSELKSLIMDPTEGIRAMPLDGSLSHWHASITGPPDCPYKDGLFFLQLEIPKSYPMRPPIARFVTKIFHPNVSFHGDVGLDALRHNWSLALTIPKVLVSIQSLLTEPYCHISMEPEIAKLCEENREEFERTAREWTSKYARLHVVNSWNEAAAIAASCTGYDHVVIPWVSGDHYGREPDGCVKHCGNSQKNADSEEE